MSAFTKLDASAYDASAFSFFQYPEEFTLGNARALMWFSQLAYETDEPDKVESILATWGLNLAPGGIVVTEPEELLPMAKTQAIVARGDGFALLAFAGTDPAELADWISDFDITPDPEGSTKGFTRALAAAMPKVRSVVSAFNLPLVVTGHSLGGALAVLAALELTEAGRPVTAVYTFGMPRPGYESFRSRFDAALGKRAYRLVYGVDVVPTVAPSFLGFRHTGRLLRCARGARFDPAQILQSEGSDEPVFATEVARKLRSVFQQAVSLIQGAESDDGPDWAGRTKSVQQIIRRLPQPIRDHLPDSYIFALH